MAHDGQADVREEGAEVADRLLGVQVGMDIAMTYDFTAVAVTQVRERMRLDRHAAPGAKESYYRVQEVTRWPHNLAAPEIATGLVELFLLIREQLITELAPAAMHGFANPRQLPPRGVYLDATGMGKAIVPSVQQALKGYRETADVAVYPITFTHGERPFDPHHFDPVNGSSAGKTHIITNLQALMHAERLDLPQSDPNAPLLRQEIDAFRYAIGRNGQETFGGEGEHDDLVIALALACLDDPRNHQVGTQDIRYW